MSEHEKAVLSAATDKTATAENLSKMSVTQKTQDGNENLHADSGYFAIDGETLMDMDLPPINYIVDELLTPGLFILAGSPKTGKSWMVLQFCLSIAQGKPIWNFLTNGKGVLYMCLEDSYRRIRRRIDQLDETATKNLQFLNTAPLLREGLETVIERHLWLHPDTNLVVIDTFQMVRGTTKESSGYAGDYADVRLLKMLADKLGITILLVHHLRKQGDDNPFNMISGTTGLTGAVDGSFVLVRDKEINGHFKLSVTGRDIEQRVLTLEFDSDACLWDMVSSESGMPTVYTKPPDVIFAICDYIKSIGSFTGSASELLTALDDTATPINTLTKALNAHKELLLDNNITYEYRRTNSKKIIELIYCP